VTELRIDNIKRKEGKAMRMKLNAIPLLIPSIFLFCGAGCTDTGRYAVSGKASTLGLGGEFTAGVTSNINARVGLNALDVDVEEEIEDVEFDMGIDLSSFSALADWYVFNGPFHLSGGIISMDNEIDLEARGLSETVVAPWLTMHHIEIGWGNPLTTDRGGIYL
jgi:hypothetical protein